MKRPAIVIAVLLLAFALLALLAHRARAQDCLATLTGCTACVQPTGAITVSSCGTASAGACPEIPASLLTAEPAILSELHQVLVDQLRVDWSRIAELMLDPRRDFVRRELEALARERPDLAGKLAVALQVAERRVYLMAAQCLSETVVRILPDGMGGDKVALLPRSTATSAACSGALRSWLAQQISRGLPAEALRRFAETGTVGLMATPESDDLAAMAAALRELGGGEDGALELLRDLAVLVSEVGADDEGGRP